MVSVVGCFMVSVVAGKRFLMVSVAGLLVDSAATGGSNILERMTRFLVFCVFKGFRRCFVSGFRYVFYGFRRWMFGGFFRRRRIQNVRTY